LAPESSPGFFILSDFILISVTDRRQRETVLTKPKIYFLER